MKSFVVYDIQRTQFSKIGPHFRCSHYVYGNQYQVCPFQLIVRLEYSIFKYFPFRESSAIVSGKEPFCSRACCLHCMWHIFAFSTFWPADWLRSCLKSSKLKQYINQRANFVCTICCSRITSMSDKIFQNSFIYSFMCKMSYCTQSYLFLNEQFILWNYYMTKNLKCVFLKVAQNSNSQSPSEHLN